MKRRKQHIPEERYDIDGTLVKNEAANLKVWDFGDIIRNPDKLQQAVKEAQQYMKTHPPLFNDDRSQPWSEQVDELFFSRRKRGLVAWWMARGSSKYFEFQGFFNKLNASMKGKQETGSASSRMSTVQKEGEVLRHALVLFHDFKAKQTAITREKIEKNRAELPITGFANAIVHTLVEHRVLLIAGDTGCGKSTQVPQILMKAGFKKIACTQPRRIACSSLARRVSYETLNEYGSEIAYQVRFEGTKTNRTRILFLTEGLLLRQYAVDPNLSMYDVIIVDEVHERHMMGDFLLALLKNLLKVRQDIHVVLMSATINAELFAQYFDAPTLIVPGRMYSVKIYHEPQGAEDKNLVSDAAYQRRQKMAIKESIPSRSELIDPAPYIKVMAYIDQHIPITERGDMLIFLSGINEITRLAEALKDYTRESKKWIILMLHSSLSVDEQDKVFDVPPEGTRKCIISSNIAETSVTIDGIRFIIDSGKVKELTHDPTSNMSKLSEFWISKASATQRTGRAGRTGPGECWRLYSQQEYEHLNDFAVPEIQRAPLEPLLLQIKAMGFGDPRKFDYVEPPSMDAINASMEFLQNIGAIDANENILTLGTILSTLPVNAVIGKMLVMATVFNLTEPILTIAAGISIQSPFTRLSPNANPEILRNRRKFDSPHGDPFTLLNLWQAWLSEKLIQKKSTRNWCRRHGVEEQRLYEMAKVRKQFEKILHDFQPGISHTRNTAEEEDEEDGTQEKMRAENIERLRRERYEERSSKRRRVLRMDYEEQEEWQLENDSASMDVRDLEFAVSNDIKRLQSRATVLSEQSIQLIKLTLCSALYPQFSIGDEHNPYRNSNEIVFHAPVKSFLSLHPTSVVAAHPHWVQGLGKNVRKDDLSVEQAMQHQLICYLQLLETNKPFILCNTLVPGIHVLLLFAKTIDTNADCSVLVIDSYYMVQFRTTAVAEYVLYHSYRLKHMWNHLMNQKISHGANERVAESVEDYIISPSVKEELPKALQKILEYQEEQKSKHKPIDMWTPIVHAQYLAQMDTLKAYLTEYMETAISAEFRIAKASELLKMYPKLKDMPESEQSIPRSWNPKDVIRTGIQITSSIYYNSINTPSTASSVPIPEEELPQSVKMYWHCPHCDTTFSFTRSQVLDHLGSCKE